MRMQLASAIIYIALTPRSFKHSSVNTCISTFSPTITLHKEVCFQASLTMLGVFSMYEVCTDRLVDVGVQMSLIARTQRDFVCMHEFPQLGI